MHKQFYFLSPVEVVKVSSQNLEEVAEWCGGKVAQTESRRVPGRMDSYVWVPTPKGSNISWAFPGMFITKRVVINMKGELRATWAVFRRDYFEKNYFETPEIAVDKTWELEERNKKKAKKGPVPTEPKKPAEYLSAQERDIKIHVGEGAQPGEPVSEPVYTTAEIEAMDAETRERIEQVNKEILAGQVFSHKSPAQQRMEAREEEVEALDTAKELVEKELGGVEIIQPTDIVQAFVHDHDLEETCDNGTCVERGDFRFHDGLHVFNDTAVEASPEGWIKVDMPAAYTEIKL